MAGIALKATGLLSNQGGACVRVAVWQCASIHLVWMSAFQLENQVLSSLHNPCSLPGPGVCG